MSKFVGDTAVVLPDEYGYEKTFENTAVVLNGLVRLKVCIQNKITVFKSEEIPLK